MTPSALLAAPAFRSRQDPQHPGFPTTFTLRRAEIDPYMANMEPIFSRNRPKRALGPDAAHIADLRPPKFPASKVSRSLLFPLSTYEPGP